MSKDYGEYSFKSGPMAGMFYREAIKTPEGLDKVRFVAELKPGDATNLAQWKNGLSSWIDSMVGEKVGKIESLETANQDLSDFSRQLIELQQRVQTNEDDIEKLKAQIPWSE